MKKKTHRKRITLTFDHERVPAIPLLVLSHALVLPEALLRHSHVHHEHRLLVEQVRELHRVAGRVLGDALALVLEVEVVERGGGHGVTVGHHRAVQPHLHVLHCQVQHRNRWGGVRATVYANYIEIMCTISYPGSYCGMRVT
jgi:hypothetical protein